MKSRITTLVFCLFFFTIIVNAQQKKGIVINGVVVDEKTKTPVEFVNVSIHNQTDSSIVTGSATGKNGEFIIPNVPEGKFFMKVAIIGYEKKLIPNITLIKEKPEYFVGTIKINQSAVLMNESQVVGEKPNEEYKLDKKVINVTQNLTAASGTALDVLQNQPSIQVDASGNVTLRGSGNFTVLLNGKPNVLQGSDALRQIPANIIDNIELITNPSAKYDAEGSAGIININTKKTTESFMSGIINGGVGTRERRNGDFSVNYREGDFSITSGLDYRKNINYSIQDIGRESYSALGNSDNSTLLDQNVTRNNYNLRLGFEYNFNDMSSLSLNGSYGNMDILAELESKVNNSFLQNNDFILINSSSNFKAKFFNTTLFFSQKFVPNVNELTFEATSINVSLPTIQKTSEFISNSSYTERSINPKMREFEDNTRRKEYRLKSNYSHKFNPKSTLEVGLQSNLFFKDLDFTNKVFDWNKSAWTTTIDMTNKFDFRNNVYSAFITYSNSLYDFDYQLGLRTELTDRLLEQITMTERYEYKKIHAFPSLNISKKFGDDQTVQLSYSKRINRPNERLLNPYPNYSDSYLISRGNPDLIPELTDSYELNYQKFFKGLFVSVQSYLRNSSNSMTQNFQVDEQGRMITTFMNFASTKTAGAELSASITAIPWFRIDPSVNLFNSSLSSNVLNQQNETNNFSWTSRLTSTLIFGADTRMQITANYIGRQFGPQLEVEPFFMFSANVRQEFFGKKLAITLQAQNLFNTVKFNVATSGDNFKSTIIVKPEQSIINLTITYNFNNFKRSARGSQNVDINVNEGI